jgi:hypothetical protein
MLLIEHFRESLVLLVPSIACGVDSLHSSNLQAAACRLGGNATSGKNSWQPLKRRWKRCNLVAGLPWLSSGMPWLHKCVGGEVEEGALPGRELTNGVVVFLGLKFC